MAKEYTNDMLYVVAQGAKRFNANGMAFYKSKWHANQRRDFCEERWGYLKGEPYEVITLAQYYERARRAVQVRNLMTGGVATIAAGDVGSVCDPSTESYWST